MDIIFDSEKLKKQLGSKEAMQKSFGLPARKVSLRLDEIRDAANLKVLQTLPAISCRPLSHNLEGRWIIKVEGKLSMIFSIDQIPVPRQNGSADTAAVTRIKIHGFLASR